MYIYIYIYIYICTSICMYTYVFTYMFIHICTYLLIFRWQSSCSDGIQTGLSTPTTTGVYFFTYATYLADLHSSCRD
jgi:nicotinamide riboside transporter PnuC